MTNKLVLYSFRRCPYAMRARLALLLNNIPFEVREINLKNKAQEFLKISPKGTVPVLVLKNGQLLDESLDIVRYYYPDFQDDFFEQLLVEFNQKVSRAITRFKYHERYDDVDITVEQKIITDFFAKLEGQLLKHKMLSGDLMSAADIILLPFVRQIYKAESDWFDRLNFPQLKKWLYKFMNSELHEKLMEKHPLWTPT